MKTRLNLRVAAVALAIGAVLPLTANAHRAWMLPSSTVLSGNEPWVTVDAAVSNDLFYFDHNPIRLDGLVLFAPDGSKVTHENASTGKYRSTFDVKLSQKGTYKFAMVNDSLNASYKIGTETKRVRGTAESLAKEIPADAKDLSVSRSQSRMEIFVTSGKPSDTVLKPTNVGLELVAVTHPNDLFTGEAGNFQMILDGKPAANIDVTVIPGGSRYRDKVGEMKVKTDADGKFSVKWPDAGMYWINASTGGGGMGGPGGAGGPGAGGPGSAPAAGAAPRPAGPVGTLAAPVRRASYSTTVEVLQN
ncbi:DUF4198 domain-containing protein [soil metagenome]